MKKPTRNRTINTTKLKSLIKMLREHGVSEFTNGEFTLKFNERAFEPVKVAAEPEKTETSKQVEDMRRKEMESNLFYSTPYDPKDFEG